MFVEQGAGYDSAKLEALSTEELADKVKHMLRDIDRISADAASDGLADYTALQALLGDTVQVKNLFKSWSDVFPAMEAAAKQFMNEPTPVYRGEFFAAFELFLALSHSNNTTFLELCMDEYRKRL